MTTSPGRLGAALILSALALALYTSTSAPGLLWADGGELQAAAITFGVPHPTGYPLLVLVGGSLARLHLMDPAFAITLVSSVMGALTLGGIVLVLGELGASIAASVAAALVYGLTFTPWHSALKAEVYTFASAIAMLALWRTLIAHRTGRARDAALAALLLGFTFTSHAAYAIPVAIAGLSLAGRAVREEARPIPRLLLLLGGFLLALTPYAQTWIADQRHAAIDYFDLVRDVNNPFGRPMPDFDGTFRRMVWNFTGRNLYPVPPLVLTPGRLVSGALETGCTLFVLDLGPVALPLAIGGFVALLGRRRVTALLLLLAALGSAAFTAILFTGEMAPLILLPATLLVTLFAGLGMDALVRRFAAWPAGARMALLALLVAAMLLPGEPLRDYADAHPLTRWRFRMQQEYESRDRSWFPNLRHVVEPAEYERRVRDRIPAHALVLAGWSELSVLRYLQAVERERQDLTLHPASWPGAADRMRAWQRAHDVAREPFVFTGRPPESVFPAALAESLEVMPGHRLYVQRTPIPDTAPPAGAP